MYNKYRNQKANYKGIIYHSKKEAAYAAKLDMLKRASGNDQVLEWIRQIRYPIDIKNKHICTLVLDFVVTYPNRIEYVDVKGYKKGVAYDLFRIKKRMVEALYDIEIKEV